MTELVQIYRHSELDSTLLEARRLWPRTAKRPFAVLARRQHGGIGRLGRTWSSPEGGLWLTLAWPATRPTPHYTALPLIVGVATARTIDAVANAPTYIQIKWPNDLLIGDRKCAGILCQAASEGGPPGLFMGIGINVGFDHSHFGTDLRHPATTLQSQSAACPAADAFEEPLLRELTQSVDLYEKEGLAPFVDEIHQRLAWLGLPVRVEQDNGDHATGELMGVDVGGAMLVHTAQGPRRFTSAEVTRVRRSD